jgi:tetratricopeptide (TPR) repeat protein
MVRSALGTAICVFLCLLVSQLARADSITPYKNKMTPGPGADAVRAGAEALQQGDLSRAEASFRHALQLMPDEPHALVLLADVEMRKGRRAEAQSYLQTAVDRNPKSAIGEEAMGRYLAAQKNDAAAESALQKAVQLDPQWAGARISLGDFYLSRGRTKDALANYREALAADPDDASAHYNLAKALEATGNDRSAETELRASARLAPQSPLPHFALGDLLSRGGRGDLAIGEYEAAGKLDPKSGAPYILIAMIQLKGGHSDLAEQSYRKAISIQPNELVALNNLAWMDLQDRQKLDEALSFAQKTVQASPSTGQYLDTLGWVYHLRGDNVQAISSLKKATAASAQDPEIHYHLGVVYEDSGLLSDALAEMNKSLSLKKDFPEAADAHRRVESLIGRVRK